MKKLIIIEGKTSSGKDTIAKYLQEKYGIPAVVSYTTRPMRAGEVDGKEHWFCSDEEFDAILDTCKVMAYTKFPKTGIRYCSTIESLEEEVSTYILNPEGLKWFKENGNSLDLEMYSIFVDLSEDIIRERAKRRGDKESDVEHRLDSEREQFDAAKAAGEYDWLIKTDQEKEKVFESVDACMAAIGIKPLADPKNLSKYLLADFISQFMTINGKFCSASFILKKTKAELADVLRNSSVEMRKALTNFADHNRHYFFIDAETLSGGNATWMACTMGDLENCKENFKKDYGNDLIRINQIVPAEGHHICKRCGKIATGENVDCLCQNCIDQ